MCIYNAKSMTHILLLRMLLTFHTKKTMHSEMLDDVMTITASYGGGVVNFAYLFNVLTF